MNWPAFYMICFLLGFGLSVISLLAGTLHLHLPHLHLHDFHGLDFGHGDAGAGAGHAQDGPSPFNLTTIAAFLAWFGGTGFLLTHYYSMWYALALGVAGLSGVGGAAVVFWFLAKVLMSHEENLDPADYDMVGVLGKVSLPIREGGTGELIFSQGGTRHVSGARSEDGKAIPKGAEVVVTRYDKGIAYVKPWEDLAGPTIQ
ncbi:MAG: hypothetical protein ACE15B_05025 [Bryobacteraceae bacterium]